MQSQANTFDADIGTFGPLVRPQFGTNLRLWVRANGYVAWVHVAWGMTLVYI